MIVAVSSRNAVEVRFMVKLITAEITAKDLFTTTYHNDILELRIEIFVVRRQTTGSVLQANMLSV